MKYLLMSTLMGVMGCQGKVGGVPVSGSENADSGHTGEELDPTAAVLVPIAGATVTLGEWDALVINRFGGDGSENQTVIPQSEFALTDYWVDRYPFPGIPEEPWFPDGLNHQTVEILDLWLADYGRRVCTVAELLYAAAGPDNHRYPYLDGTYNNRICDPDDTNPLPIGAYPDCESAHGIRDFQVRSTWGKLDARTEEVMGATPQASNFPAENSYAVWGGTSRTDTFYAPTNFGFHLHGVDEVPYQDDGFRVCAGPNEPTEEQDTAYAYWVQTAIDAGSYAGMFD